jgi:hypothetical protein
LNHHILGLEVSVKDSLLMEKVDRLGDSLDEIVELLPGWASLSIDLRQGRTVDSIVNQSEFAVRALIDTVQIGQPRMMQVHQQPNFSEDPISIAAEPLPQSELDRHLLTSDPMFAFPNLSETSSTQQGSEVVVMIETRGVHGSRMLQP